MDEPLAALDLHSKEEILPFLDRLFASAGIPVLYVSHAPDEVARLADHLLLMEEGTVLAQGPLAEVLGRVAGAMRIRLAEAAARAARRSARAAARRVL